MHSHRKQLFECKLKGIFAHHLLNSPFIPPKQKGPIMRTRYFWHGLSCKVRPKKGFIDDTWLRKAWMLFMLLSKLELEDCSEVLEVPLPKNFLSSSLSLTDSMFGLMAGSRLTDGRYRGWLAGMGPLGGWAAPPPGYDPWFSSCLVTNAIHFYFSSSPLTASMHQAERLLFLGNSGADIKRQGTFFKRQMWAQREGFIYKNFLRA